MTTQTVNIGILAHVDAGKTSLTERLLFDTGVIGQLGSVDAGTTQTDTGEIERSRGITIRSAVASFTVGDRRVNLIDTPGHSDFVAEVERALGVLDGAVLVLSAVEGVQPHTRVLMKILKSLRLPTLIFINKIDRPGARSDELIADIVRLLTPSVAPMGTVRGIGAPKATFLDYDVATADWAPVLAEHDDALLADLVNGVTASPARLWEVLRRQTATGATYPLLFGSALTGEGISALLDAIQRLLPPAPESEEQLRGRVFAIERGIGGAKTAYVRSYGGQLRERKRVTVFRRTPDGRIISYPGQVTAMKVIGAATHLQLAGDIATVRGLTEIRIGDQIGSPDGLSGEAYFAPPSMETVVRPRRASESTALHAALMSLADQDPLIHTRVTSESESSVLLYGEVQKDVIAATLADVYGIEVTFAESEVVHIERPIGVGTAVEYIGHGFLATIGLRVEPGAVGSGVTYRLEAEPGSLLPSFLKAIDETVRSALQQGLHGWPVTDIIVTLTNSGYWARPFSAAGDFRDLTPLVLLHALAVADTCIFEPCHRFELEIPLEQIGPITAELGKFEARIDTTDDIAAAWHITGEIPARLVHDFQRRLPSLSNGQGVWSSRSAGDRAIGGRAPQRRRSDGNPLDRTEYMRFLAQRSLDPTR